MDYNRLAETAKRLLAEYGADQVLQRVTVGAYNPATGTATTTTSNVTVSAAAFPVKGDMNVNGTSIITGDQYALISGVDVASVSVNDLLVLNGVTWHVIAVLTTMPSDVAVVHKVYIRK